MADIKLKDRIGTPIGYTDVDVINIPDLDTGESVSYREVELGTLNADSNGEYNAPAKTAYNTVNVNVPNTYTNADEGKVVHNGNLVSQTPRSSDITSNGTYDTTMNATVTVNVPDELALKIVDRSITAIMADDLAGANGIGTFAFAQCTRLGSADLSGINGNIGNGAFQGCSSLSSVVLPMFPALGGIGNNAFYNCTSLRSITSYNVDPPRIESNTFFGVPADCAIYVPAESVDAYKAAANWSDRAAYIQAIPSN